MLAGAIVACVKGASPYDRRKASETSPPGDRVGTGDGAPNAGGFFSACAFIDDYSVKARADQTHQFRLKFGRQLLRRVSPHPETDGRKRARPTDLFRFRKNNVAGRLDAESRCRPQA